MIHDHQLADTKRDAVALFRAVLGGDREGAHAVTGNTRCEGCLAVQAAVLGLILAAQYADSISIGPDGWLQVTGDERDELDAGLAEMLGGLTGPGEAT